MATGVMVRRVLKFQDGTVVKQTVQVLSVPHRDTEEQKRLTMAEGRRFAEELSREASGALQWLLGKTTATGVVPVGMTLQQALAAFGVVSVGLSLEAVELSQAASVLVQPASGLVLSS